MKPGVWLPGASLPAVTRGAEVPQWLRVMSSARSQHQMPQSWRWRGGGGSPRLHLPQPGDQAQGCVKGQPSTAGLSLPLPSARPGPNPRPAGSPGGERAAAGSPSAHLPRERQGATGTVGRWNSKGR